MSRFNTGNPLGSGSPLDLDDNAKNLDVLTNSREAISNHDRFGVQRKTWHGMERDHEAAQSSRAIDFDNFLQASGYQDLGEYAPGIEITAHNQYVTFGGQPYLLKPSIPVPYTTSGEWAGDDFKLIGDNALRQDLANPDKGVLMVRGAVIYVDTIADLQALPTSELVDGQQASVLGRPFAYSGTAWVAESYVTPKIYGAVGDGVADDSAAFEQALQSGYPVDGEGLSYKLVGTLSTTQEELSLSNMSIVGDTDINSLTQINATCTKVVIKNVHADLGRGTYKTGVESWKSFPADGSGGILSITPTLRGFINITATTESAVVSISSSQFINIPNSEAFRVRCYGDVFLNDLVFKNCAEKSYNIYHTDNAGVVNLGRTFASNVYAEDIGILPDSFLVDGTPQDFATTNYAPHASFNFVVTFGEYHLTNARCKNYGSCGVTADRNKIFVGNNIAITSDNPKAFSNNPPGALWDENCGIFEVNNVYIDIANRDSREAGVHGSAIQLFSSKDGHVRKIKNTIVKTDGSVRLALRSSLRSDCEVFIDGLYVDSDSPINIVDLPNKNVSGSVTLSNIVSHTGKSPRLRIAGMRRHVLSGISLKTSDIEIMRNVNIGTVGDCESISLNGVNANTLTVSLFPKMGTVTIDSCVFSGNITIPNGYTETSVLLNNTTLGRLRLTQSSPSGRSSNQAIITGCNFKDNVRIFNYNRVAVIGCYIEGNIQVEDIWYLNIFNNFISSFEPTALIHLTGTSYRIAHIKDNTLLFNTGVTTGAYFNVPTVSLPYVIIREGNIEKTFDIA